MLCKVKHVCPRNMDNALIVYDLYSMWNTVRDKNAIFLNGSHTRVSSHQSRCLRVTVGTAVQEILEARLRFLAGCWLPASLHFITMGPAS